MSIKISNPTIKKILYAFLDHLVSVLGAGLFWIILFWLLYLQTWTERLVYIVVSVFGVIAIGLILEKLFPSSERD